MSETAEYTGTDLLETMAEARNYNAFLLGEVLRHGKAVRAVDFGAGCGTFARALRGQGRDVVCIELDPGLRQRLQEQGFVCHADLAGLAEDSADFIFSLNVLEHIEDDEAAIDDLFRHLKPGGRIYIYVPAFPLLYSSMDRKVGHFRRYRLAGMKRKLTTAGFRIAEARYADSLGFLVSLLYRFIGSREGEINPRTLAFYDRVLFPISRVLDRFVGRWLGKNVAVAAYRPIDTAVVLGDAPRTGRVAA